MITRVEVTDDAIIPIKAKTKMEKTFDKITGYIQSKGFTFSEDTIKNYYISLRTKPFVILTGISGTGKTQITQLFAQALYGDEKYKSYSKIVPVRPDWNDDKYLIGFFNPLTKEYHFTPFLEFLLLAGEEPDKPFFICLDEMNLARVEYYFSTFLSAMESNKEIELYSSKDKLNDTIFEIENKTIELKPIIKIPPNLFFVGTVNMDETTYQFSPKVLDRANTIEFNEVNLTQERRYEQNNTEFITEQELTDLFPFENNKEEYSKWKKDHWQEIVIDKIQKIQEILKTKNLHFGYRIRDEILKYMFYSRELLNFETAFDFQVMQKILPRIKGTNQIKELLEQLKELFKEWELHKSINKIEEMEERLKDEGYTSFF